MKDILSQDILDQKWLFRLAQKKCKNTKSYYWEKRYPLLHAEVSLPPIIVSQKQGRNNKCNIITLACSLLATGPVGWLAVVNPREEE